MTNEFIFKEIESNELTIVLALFKDAAEKINKKNVNHWQYWIDPPQEKISWVKEGIENREFFFIEEISGKKIGMIRILNSDELYWGEQDGKAKYIHSLVIKEEYNGKGMGLKVINEVEKMAKNAGCNYLRLDADAKNPKLCGYYENLQFEKVGIKHMGNSAYNLYQKVLG